MQIALHYAGYRLHTLALYKNGHLTISRTIRAILNNSSFSYDILNTEANLENAHEKYSSMISNGENENWKSC